MVTTFIEWKDFCVQEYEKLHGVIDYLTAEGKEKMLVYGLMMNLACYCDSAAELAEWIETKKDLEKEDLKLLESVYANRPISHLKKVAKLESSEEKIAELAQHLDSIAELKKDMVDLESEKTTFYVTYRIDARFVAEVHADDAEEAKELAAEKWMDADFGAAEDINGEPIIIENEFGDFIWEK